MTLHILRLKNLKENLNVALSVLDKEEVPIMRK